MLDMICSLQYVALELFIKNVDPSLFLDHKILGFFSLSLFDSHIHTLDFPIAQKKLSPQRNKNFSIIQEPQSGPFSNIIEL